MLAEGRSEERAERMSSAEEGLVLPLTLRYLFVHGLPRWVFAQPNKHCSPGSLLPPLPPDSP